MNEICLVTSLFSGGLLKTVRTGRLLESGLRAQFFFLEVNVVLLFFFLDVPLGEVILVYDLSLVWLVVGF